MAVGSSARVFLLVLVAAAGDLTYDKHSQDPNANGDGDEDDKGSLLKFLKSHGEKRELAPCHGDTRYLGKGDKNICQHLGFRFCMRLLNDDGTPYIFYDRDSENSTDKKNVQSEKREDVNKDGLDWWEWSLQPQHKDSWIKGILKTGGRNWCTCALCTAEAVSEFGCDNLDIQCNATDVAFIRYRVEHDKHMVLSPGWECLKKKCGEDYQKGWPIVGHDCKHRGCARLYDGDYENALMPESEALGNESSRTGSLVASAAAAALLSLAAGIAFWRRQRGASVERPWLTVEADDVDAALE